MSKKINIINNIITMVITIALFFLVTIVGQRYTNNLWQIVFLLLAGAVIAIFICTFFHELGHLLGGLKNKYAFIRMCVWFFCWKKVGKKVVFSFCGVRGEAGYTEMIPTTSDNISKRHSSYIKWGLMFSFIPILIGIVPLFLTFLPKWAYCLWVMLLPIGGYSFLDNLLPMESDGFKNDGLLLLDLKKDNDSSKVMTSLLTIQAEMYQGKTPIDIDPKLYFDLPQLPENDINYARLLLARYDYYLEKEDYDNVKDVTNRLVAIEDYLPTDFWYVVKTNQLYNYSTFDFDADKADDITYEIERFLNLNNNSLTIRAKLAYILFVRGEKEVFEQFYKKGIREANRSQICGYSIYEKKLLERIKLKIS